jgi:hypothetical protein
MSLVRTLFPTRIPADKRAARIAIAKDVVKHVNSRHLLATRGLYLSVKEAHEDIQHSFDDIAASLSLEGNHTVCSVCGIGAACMAAVGLYDQAPDLQEGWSNWHTDHKDNDNWDISEYALDSDMMLETLGKWFSQQQLSLIECAFEASEEHQCDSADYEDREAAAQFRPTEDFSAEEAMRDIFQNIVDNNGTFMP